MSASLTVFPFLLGVQTRTEAGLKSSKSHVTGVRSRGAGGGAIAPPSPEGGHTGP